MGIWPLHPNVHFFAGGKNMTNYVQRVRQVLPDILADLLFLCCLQRDPRRGERCPGMVMAIQRRDTRTQRPPDTWTSIDYLIDFLKPGQGLAQDIGWALGSIGRAAMPGPLDPPSWHDSRSLILIAELPALARRGGDIGQAQMDAWQGGVLACGRRCGVDPGLLLEMLRMVCFEPEVTTARMDFAERAATLLAAVHARCRTTFSDEEAEMFW